MAAPTITLNSPDVEATRRAPVFVGATTASHAGSASLVLSKPAGVREGDLLYLTYVVGDVVAEGATLTLPAGWTFDGFSSPFSAVRALNAFKYATAEDESDDVTDYTFTYTASRPVVATLAAVRFAVRDYQYDTASWPAGYFAPSDSQGGASSGTSTTLSSVTGSFPETLVNNVLVTFAFIVYDSAGGSPTIGTPSAGTVQASVAIAKLALKLASQLSASPVAPVPAITATASASKPWRVQTVTFEPGLIPMPDKMDFAELVITSIDGDLTSGAIEALIGGVAFPVWDIDDGLTDFFIAGGTTVVRAVSVVEAATYYTYTFLLRPRFGWNGGTELNVGVIRLDDADTLQQFQLDANVPRPVVCSAQPDAHAGGVPLELD